VLAHGTPGADSGVVRAGGVDARCSNGAVACASHSPPAGGFDDDRRANQVGADCERDQLIDSCS